MTTVTTLQYNSNSNSNTERERGSNGNGNNFICLLRATLPSYSSCILRDGKLAQTGRRDETSFALLLLLLTCHKITKLKCSNFSSPRLSVLVKLNSNSSLPTNELPSISIHILPPGSKAFPRSIQFNSIQSNSIPVLLI